MNYLHFSSMIRKIFLQLNFLLVALVNLGLLLMPISLLRVLWLRIWGMNVDWKCSIQSRIRITSIRGPIVIGPHSIVGVGVLLDNRRGIYIGQNVNISRECILLSLGHDIGSPDFPTKGGEVKISDHAWLFMRVSVMPSVVIGENSVIFPFSCVTKSTESFSVYGGVPAVRISIKPAARSLQEPYRYISAF